MGLELQAGDEDENKLVGTGFRRERIMRLGYTKIHERAKKNRRKYGRNNSIH